MYCIRRVQIAAAYNSFNVHHSSFIVQQNNYMGFNSFDVHVHVQSMTSNIATIMYVREFKIKRFSKIRGQDLILSFQMLNSSSVVFRVLLPPRHIHVHILVYIQLRALIVKMQSHK